MALTAAQKKAQKAEEAATKAAYEAAKAAMLNNLNTGLSDMKENVSNDALTRGLARSSVPITMGADNETTMRTAYNTDLAGLTANRDSTLAQILARYASMGTGGGGSGTNNYNPTQNKLPTTPQTPSAQQQVAAGTSYDTARAEQNYSAQLRAEAQRRAEEAERRRLQQQREAEARARNTNRPAYYQA